MRRFILCAVVLSACARRASERPVEVRDAWARAADSAAVTAVYFTVLNHESSPVTLVSVTSPAAESVTLHETMQMEGMVHMMPLDSAQTIAAGDSLVLAEGAKHLMLTGLRRTLVGGDTVALALTFADGRVLHASAAVRAP